eukprot:9087519-Pyramimonas_sp.AAC.1
MLYRTELLDLLVLVQRKTAALILGISHHAIGVRVLVEFTLTKGVLHALGALVSGVLCAGHIGVVNMFGREQAAARLELFVVGRGSETGSSCGPSEL